MAAEAAVLREVGSSGGGAVVGGSMLLEGADVCDSGRDLQAGDALAVRDTDSLVRLSAVVSRLLGIPVMVKRS